ncbi:ABC transporter ATP-binding protein [Ruegeria sp. HKCCA5426]|uniref:ABC transporter ATP-binding protein n=1 Tax=Ruegeria sp. HKCCA5426 TaxID=2682985 RepID=UPI001488F357|nr:ABC transporter ATP-binding protein [Ruegeria sp. HKCCA5426]
MTSALEITNLRKSFGQTEIIRGVDLSVRKGERHAVIGPNGAGKSTLYNLITGRFAQTAGTVQLHGQDLRGKAPFQINRLGLSRSFQITNIFPNMSVFENIRCALLWTRGYKYSFWTLVSRKQDLTDATDEILAQINLTTRRDLPAGVLSYAEQRALEIGITIAGGADVIMLDEPTAGMSHSETDYIVELIRQVTENKTLMMVEHDMGVVFGLADRISVLVYGEIIATGTPEEVRGNPRVQEAYLGTAMEDH